MSAFARSIENFASRNALFQQGGSLIVAVSGGPDSVALLHTLCELQAKYAWKIRVAHVNYGLRGRSSDADERFVRGLADRYSLLCSVKKMKIPKKSANLEALLRDSRYAYFEELRKRYRANAVVVAHTADEQAETLMLRLFRGGGMRSLAAMRPKTASVIRPLLGMTKKQILAYLKQNKFGYRVDKSNIDLQFTRNRIRHRILPYLARMTTPGLPRLLADEASILGEEYAFLESEAFQKEKTLGVKAFGRAGLAFSVRAFLRMETGLRLILLRMWVERLSGGRQGLTGPQMFEILNMLSRFKNKDQKIAFGRLKILRKGDKVMLIYS